jgi:hypothetical protein
MKKGFVFSLDAVMAVFLFIFVLITVFFFVSQSEGDYFGALAVSRVGKDALAAMDRSGDLSSMDGSRINDSLSLLLPTGVKMHVRIDTYYYDNESFVFMSQSDFGPDIPDGKAIFGARRDFPNTKNGIVSNYSVAKAFIWQD